MRTPRGIVQRLSISLRQQSATNGLRLPASPSSPGVRSEPRPPSAGSRSRRSRCPGLGVSRWETLPSRALHDGQSLRRFRIPFADSRLRGMSVRLCQTFGFTERSRYGPEKNPDGAQLAIGLGSVFLVSPRESDNPPNGTTRPSLVCLGPRKSPTLLTVHVDVVTATTKTRSAAELVFSGRPNPTVLGNGNTP
jgi:hypothetical protein